MFNSFGNILRLTSFGESHGKGVGGVIDGFPAGIVIDMDFVQAELDRRRPGQSRITTARKEGDKVEFLSGIFEEKSTGCPIGFIVWNQNQHSDDYNNLKEVYRPSHADYTYKVKYGIRDHRGGGRSSARETISRVVAGALAKLALKQLGIHITAYTSQVGPIRLEENYTAYDLDLIETNPVRCPDPAKAKEMEELIFKIKGEGDTIGGVVTCVVKGCPIGLGQPVFGKLHAALGNAMLSINAAKAFGTILNTISAIITPMLKIAYGALSGALAISESSAGMPITANPMSSENSLFIKFCGPTTSTRSPTFNLALDISPFSGFPFLLSPMAFSPNSFLSLISERVLPMYSDSGRTEISAMPICMDLSSRFFP